MKRAPFCDVPDRLGDAREAVGTRLAHDDVVGVALGQRVAGRVQGRGQADLADDERRAAGALVGQEPRRGQGRGEDRLLGDLDAALAQPGREVAPRVERVVGEHEERQPALAQERDEAVGARDQVLLVDEHAVHVHEPRTDGRPRVGHGQLGGRWLQRHGRQYRVRVNRAIRARGGRARCNGCQFVMRLGSVCLVVAAVVVLALPGVAAAARTPLTVSPAPGTPDASPKTGISVLGVPAAASRRCAWSARAAGSTAGASRRSRATAAASSCPTRR